MPDHRESQRQRAWDWDLRDTEPPVPSVPPVPTPSTPPTRVRSGSGLSTKGNYVPPTQPTGPSIAEAETMDLNKLKRICNEQLKSGENDD